MSVDFYALAEQFNEQSSDAQQVYKEAEGAAYRKYEDDSRAAKAAAREASNPLEQVYNDARNKAITVRDEKMREVRTAYEEEIRPVETAYNEGYTAINKERDERLAEVRTEYDAAIKAAKEAREAADIEVLTKLTEGVEDSGVDEGVLRVFRWMVGEGNVWRNYNEHCAIVLKALPMSLPALERLRGNHGWCSTFDDFLGKAIKAGVMPDITEADAAEYRLTQALNSNLSYEDTKKAIRTAMEDVIALKIAEAVAAAKAELEKTEDVPANEVEPETANA